MVRPSGGGIAWCMDRVDRRLGGDRRVYTVRSLGRCFVAPRRMHGRRSTDRREAVLDRMDSGSVSLAILLVLCSIADAMFTLTLISRGGSEINPVMNALMHHSIWAFAAVKMFLTTVPALILVATSNLRLFGRWRARSILAALVGLYLGLIVYEIALLSIS